MCAFAYLSPAFSSLSLSLSLSHTQHTRSHTYTDSHTLSSLHAHTHLDNISPHFTSSSNLEQSNIFFPLTLTLSFNDTHAHMCTSRKHTKPSILSSSKFLLILSGSINFYWSEFYLDGSYESLSGDKLCYSKLFEVLVCQPVQVLNLLRSSLDERLVDGLQCLSTELAFLLEELLQRV